MLTRIKNFLNPYADRTKLLRDLRQSFKTISQLGVHFVTEAGNFIDFKTFILPTEFYIPLLDGMLCRVSETPTDIKIDGEDVFVPYLGDMDYENGTVIFKKAFAGVIFPIHYHLENENLLLINGACKLTYWTGAKHDILNEKMLVPGVQFVIPKMCPHKLEFLEDTIMIANLRPKVPALIQH